MELRSAVGGQVLHPDGTLYRPGPTTTNDDDDGGDGGGTPGLDLGTTSGLNGSESTALTIAVGAACGILLSIFVAGLVAYAMHVASGADREAEAEEENRGKSTSAAFVSGDDGRGSAGGLVGGADQSHSELAEAGSSANTLDPAAFRNLPGEHDGASGTPMAEASVGSPSSPLRSARLATRRITVRASPGSGQRAVSSSRNRSRPKRKGLGVLPARSDLSNAVDGTDGAAKSFSSTASPIELSGASNNRERSRGAHGAKPNGCIGAEAVRGTQRDIHRSPRADQPCLQVTSNMGADGNASGGAGTTAEGASATAVHSNTPP